ncbi:MAG: PhoH family protein [Elusimicrobiaceae bacterium]|nr:PhoH family protein [Elusimicrobiaceae bacterium]
MPKIFILDTNVLLHDYNSLNKFQDNTVVIPIAVIEELDTFKKGDDELSKHARMISRHLDACRTTGKLSEGVPTKDGGIIRVTLDMKPVLPEYFKLSVPDNRILNTAVNFKSQKDTDVIVVSKDTNLRIKAEALGIEAQDYEAGKVKLDTLYTGITEAEVNSPVIDMFYKNREIKLEEGTYFPNQFLILKDNANPKHSAIGRISAKDGFLRPLAQNDPVCWGIKPLNKEQRFAMELLLDESVDIVTMVGQAGTGKTLISLAAGLQKAIDDDVYRRLVVCRSIVPVGRDIGFLPGTKDEKLNIWMGAIFDNLEYLADRKSPDEGSRQSDYLVESGRVEIASVTHIRGRSLPKQYMIVDDAQNLTPHEIKTILSRAGEGTKVVVTGDPGQIDTPYLDQESNGLTYLVDRFKGQNIYGHITFSKTERSRLAALVSELL